MADRDEVDDLGEPVAAGDPTATDVLRRQVEATLRFMRLSTLIGVVVIAILAAILSGIRGVLILVGIVYLLTSAVAYWYLRRNLSARIGRGVPPG